MRPTRVAQKAGVSPLYFALRKRMQPQNFHAPGQGIRQFGQQQHVCRSGQEEAARLSICVNGSLQRKKELGDPLYLVQNDARGKLGHKGDGVLPGSAKPVFIIESDVAVAGLFAHHACQGGLAALPGAVN